MREQQGITCSVGVAPIKFVAKIASARCKPDGLLVVPAAGLLEFLHPLPASALWGVGERAEEVLTRLGLRTVGDIAHVPLATLQRELGGAVGEHLWSLAWGRDERRVVPRREEKSVGAEETFSTDVDDPVVIRRELLRLSGRTARALRAAGCVARTISVKLRLASFKTITRSKTLAEPTDVARVIYATAVALYEGSGLVPRAVLRLVRVRAAGLRRGPVSRRGGRAAAGVRRPPGLLAGGGTGGRPDRPQVRHRRGAACQAGSRGTRRPRWHRRPGRRCGPRGRKQSARSEVLFQGQCRASYSGK